MSVNFNAKYRLTAKIIGVELKFFKENKVTIGGQPFILIAIENVVVLKFVAIQTK